MKLNDQIKKMALVAASILVLVLAYFLVVTPTQGDIEVLERDIAGLRTEKTRLEGLQAQLPQLQAEMEENTRDMNATLQNYPKVLPQEATILFIDRTEKLIPLSLISVGFGRYLDAVVASGGAPAGEAEEGEGEEPAMVVTTTAIGDHLTATEAELTFSYVVGYPQFKQFLNYILTYDERMVVRSLGASFSPETQEVSGSFMMRLYAIDGPGRPPVVIEDPAYELGTSNLFIPSYGTFDMWDTGAYISPDFFLMISSTGPAWTMGRSRDVSEDSYIVLAENTGQDIVMTFTGTSGDYEVAYRLGDEEYTGPTVRFEKDDSLNVDIYSFVNVGRRPNVLASVSIYNQTDLAVNVTIYDDDEENPRVKIANTSGIVRVRNQ
jgi:hypothetical protein